MSGRPPHSDHLRISLEPHLVELLRPLVDAVPAPLSAELEPLLSEQASSPTPTISYALLRSISRWARTEEAASTLKSKDPPLDLLSYDMVSLLAGTRTSPDKKFPQFPQPSTRSEIAARDISDRRAILAVLNALLSVICTGAAVWWAAQRTGWRDEWKVLMSLLAATTVAISEVGLYIIWESRPRRTPAAPKSHNAPSRNVSEETSSTPVSLSSSDTPFHVPSQGSTSVDPHQAGAGIALRHRRGSTL
ncbi:hypothetical protein BC827DRAFT_1123603 [Russula dissimulans]|nr:hypothetical protein BC827DRAFT_1123603 [Russula dissimulans]